MFDNLFLTLRGMAKLVNFYQINHDWVAQLKVINHHSTNKVADDVWIFSRVYDKNLISMLSDLNNYLNSSSIILQFKVEYSHFEINFSGLPEADCHKSKSYEMIQFKGVLLSIEDYFINGTSELGKYLSQDIKLIRE